MPRASLQTLAPDNCPTNTTETRQREVREPASKAEELADSTLHSVADATGYRHPISHGICASKGDLGNRIGLDTEVVRSLGAGSPEASLGGKSAPEARWGRCASKGKELSIRDDVLAEASHFSHRLARADLDARGSQRQ